MAPVKSLALFPRIYDIETRVKKSDKAVKVDEVNTKSSVKRQSEEISHVYRLLSILWLG